VRKSVVAATAVIVIVGLGVAAVPLAEEYSARQIKAGIELDGAAAVEAVEVGIFSRRVTFHNLHAWRVGDITIGRWEASGLSWPLGELLRGRTPLSGLRLGDPLQARHLELKDLRIAADDATWSVDSLTIDGLDLARYDTAGLGSMQFSALAARIAAALSIQRFEQKQIVYTAPGTADRTAIGAFTVERFDHGRIGAMALADLEASPKGQSAPAFRMSELKVTGLDLARPLKALSSAAWRPGMPVGRISVEKASATGFSGEGLSRYGISLGSITTETTHEGKEVSRSRTRIDGFILAPPLSGLEAIQVRLVLTAMGLKEIKLGFDCAGTEDRARAEIAIDRCALAGPDLAEITLSAKLVRADDAFWRAIDEGDSLALFRTTAALGAAKLVIADKGLLERTLKAVATTTGRSPVEMRAIVAREVRQFQPSGVLITEDLTELLDTVARFIETGGTLTIDAKPDPPVGLEKVSYLRTPGPDWVSVLGLSATLSR
jgi:hypothetical protein